VSDESKQRLMQSLVFGGTAGGIVIAIGQLVAPAVRLPLVAGAIMVAGVIVTYLILQLRDRAKRRTSGGVAEEPQSSEATPEAEMLWTFTEGRITRAQADRLAADRALQKSLAHSGVLSAAVESAVKDGVITQAQADEILSRS
jgi:hypothetical protein